jgi:hypothetical protein
LKCNEKKWKIWSRSFGRKNIVREEKKLKKSTEEREGKTEDKSTELMQKGNKGRVYEE